MSPSDDMKAFREIVQRAKHIVVLTGAGISAESGVPTFRGAGGFWRKYQAQNLATPTAFAKNPGLVWEFYHYRREVVFTKKPNPVSKSLLSMRIWNQIVVCNSNEHFCACRPT
jgi:NAD-dependent SIR2 family protein deacetylase